MNHSYPLSTMNPWTKTINSLNFGGKGLKLVDSWTEILQVRAINYVQAIPKPTHMGGVKGAEYSGNVENKPIKRVKPLATKPGRVNRNPELTLALKIKL